MKAAIDYFVLESEDTEFEIVIDDDEVTCQVQ